MNKNIKVYIAGHRGMVGAALLRELQASAYTNLVFKTHSELDLCDEEKTRQFIRNEKPDLVILSAAKVGGILANNKLRADFIYQNIKIQNNVIWASHEAQVPHLIFLGSSCVYPRIPDREIYEEDLLSGHLEYTNRPYAVAKIAGLELINSINEQFGKQYFSLNPTNLYGPGDHYDEFQSHVLPALIIKFHKAKLAQEKEVHVMGSGNALRELMYVDDLARAVIKSFEVKDRLFNELFMTSKQKYYHLNVGSGQECSIRDLAQLIAATVGYTGSILFGDAKDDGAPKKKVNLDFCNQYLQQQLTPLKVGIQRSYEDYLKKLTSS